MKFYRVEKELIEQVQHHYETRRIINFGFFKLVFLTRKKLKEKEYKEIAKEQSKK